MSFFGPLRWAAGLATSTVNGLMSAADFAKLAGMSAGAGVTSVFGRAGVVVAAVNDYVASQVDNNSAVSGDTVKEALETLGTAITGLTTAIANVVSGATSFTGAITAPSFIPVPAAPVYSASLSLDANTQHHDVGKLTGNITITPTNAAIGKSFTFSVKQDATGSRTVTITPPGGYTLDADVGWADSNPQPGANTRTLYTIVFYAQDGTNYCGWGKSFRT